VDCQQFVLNIIQQLIGTTKWVTRAG
jgi:hypothetical protein